MRIVSLIPLLDHTGSEANCEAKRGKAWQSVAKRGIAWQSVAKCGKAKQSKVKQTASMVEITVGISRIMNGLVE